VGKVSADHLHRRGIRTFGDVQRMTVADLQTIFGNTGEHLHRLAHGIDDRPISRDREAKSISQETTFGQDVGDIEAVRTVLLGQAEQVAGRLRRAGLLAKTVTVKIRYGQFQTITRSATLNDPTDSTDRLWQATKALFDRWADASFHPVRLIGVGAGRLGEPTGVQQSLFTDPQDAKKRQLDDTLDRIRNRYGGRSIHRGGA
jgi:DNA polymerase-4